MEDKDTRPASKSDKYFAFVSYSHFDHKWGVWLHRSLERYRVPRSLWHGQTPNRAIPKRLIPIFRDEEELPACASLSTRIQEALDRSENLLVVCSPNASRSRWVNEEILQFKRSGKEDRIFCLIIDGEPNAERRGLSPERECYPQALRFRIGAEGDITNQPVEQLAADIREGVGTRRNARLKLIAGLIDVGLDELVHREGKRRLQRLITAAASAMVIVSVVVTLLIMEAHQRSVAEREVYKNQREVISSMVDKGWDRHSRGEIPQGILSFTKALHLEEQLTDSQYFDSNELDDHRVRVGDVLGHYPHLKQLWRIENFSGIAFHPDAKRFATFGNELQLWDAETGVSRVIDALPGPVEEKWFGQEGEQVFAVTRKNIPGTLESTRYVLHAWDLESGRRLWEPQDLGANLTSDITVADEWLVYLDENGQVQIRSLTTGRLNPGLVQQSALPRLSSVAVSADGHLAGVYVPPSGLGDPAESVIGFWDIHTGKPAFKPARRDEWISRIRFSADGMRLIVSKKDVLDLVAGTWLTKDISKGLASPSGRLLAYQTEQGGLELKRIDTGTSFPLARNPQTTAIPRLFSSDDKLLIVQQDQKLIVWDIDAEKPLRELTHWGNPKFGVDSRSIISDQWLTQWFYAQDAMTGRALVWPIRLDSNLRGHNFDSASRWLIIASERIVTVWDLHSKHDRMRRIGEFSGGTHLLPADHGDYVAVISRQTPPGEDPFANHLRVQVLDNSLGQVVGVRDFPWFAERFLSESRLCWDPSGRFLLLDTAERLVFWDPLSDAVETLESIDSDHVVPNQSRSFLRDNARMRARSPAGVELWDVVLNKKKPALRLNCRFPNEPFAMRNDGSEYVYQKDRRTGEVFWQDGTQLAPPAAQWSPQHAQFSPDGRILAVVHDDRYLSLCDTRKRNWIGQPRAVVPSSWPPPLHFSPDSRRLAIRDLDTFRLWDLPSGNPLATPDHFKCSDLAFRDDGHWIVARTDNNAMVFNSAHGDLVSIASLPALRDAQFAGNDLLLLDATGGVFHYSLAADPRESEALQNLARIISAHKMDEGGEPIPLRDDEMLALWRRLQGHQNEAARRHAR